VNSFFAIPVTVLYGTTIFVVVIATSDPEWR
jgi:hypothetical protein